MGRTIHWSIRPKEKGLFSIEDLDKLNEIGERIRDSNHWTCEAFDLSIGIYPNWQGLKKTHGKEIECQSGWDIVNKEWDQLAKQGKSYTEIEIVLVKSGLALFHNDKYRKELRGFCKVGGNELNAFAVIMGLVVASIKVDCIINVSDEGKFLKCPIVIEKGKARPNHEEIQRDIGYWLSTALWDESYKGYKDRFNQLAKEYYDIDHNHNPRYHPGRCEWPITEFCRPINPEDFKDHPEYSGSQIMADFYGEYFGLNGDKDPEAESYRMTALIQKLLPKDCKIEIAPKLEH